MGEHAPNPDDHVEPEEESDDPVRPDGEIHPCSLILFCGDHTPPQPVEIVSRLEAAGLPVVESDAGPTVEGTDVIWGCALKLDDADTPCLFFTTRRDDDYTPWEWAPVGWASREEFEQTRASRWLLHIETLAEPGNPTAAYHRLLRIAAAASEGLATACFDMQAYSLRSATTLRELARCEAPPAPSELFAIQYVVDGERGWMHTHGLRRFDLPDLEILAVPPGRASEGHTLLTWLVAYLLHENVPNEGCEVAFGADLATRLKPATDAAGALPADAPGGTESRDEEHAGWRLAVLDAEGDAPCPVRLLEKISEDPVFWLSDEESLRRAQLARERFGLAAAVWLGRNGRDKRFGVKVGVPADEQETDFSDRLDLEDLPEDASREHMWFTVKSVTGGAIEGVLDNRPMFATYMRLGETYRLPVAQVSGFALFVDGAQYTPENITELDLVTWRTPGAGRMSPPGEPA